MALRECSEVGLSVVGYAARGCKAIWPVVGLQVPAPCCFLVGGCLSGDCAVKSASLLPLSPGEESCSAVWSIMSSASGCGEGAAA